MKALVLAREKHPLVYQDVPEPQPGDGRSLVSLRAAALNRRDYWITQGMYPGVSTPCILGSDGSGVAGDRDVIICPGIAWGDSQRAQQAGFRILGMPDDGTFAESVAVPTVLLHDKPSHLSWHEAAALPLAGLTAYRALVVQAGLQPGQMILISGAGGGVAVFAVQFAVALGANVFVTSSSDEKIGRAMELGAAAGANYRTDGWTKEFRKRYGSMDVVIDSAGGEGYNDLLGLLRPGGRIVSYGVTAGSPGKLDMFRVFWNQLHIVGSTMGSPDDFTAMLQFVNEHRLHPVVDRVVPLAHGSELIASMGGMSQFGKLVLDIHA